MKENSIFLNLIHCMCLFAFCDVFKWLKQQKLKILLNSINSAVSVSASSLVCSGDMMYSSDWKISGYFARMQDKVSAFFDHAYQAWSCLFFDSTH